MVNEWNHDADHHPILCRYCWADLDVMELQQWEEYRPDNINPGSWDAIALPCDRCKAYDNCFKPEVEPGAGNTWDSDDWMCWSCFQDWHDESLWGCDECGAEVLCWKGDDSTNVCSDCWIKEEYISEEEEEAEPEPPQKRPRNTGPPQQGPPPPTNEVNARQRNLRDQRKLREWYPDFCTFHLFYHHAMQRPATAGCTLAKEGDNFCRQGGRKRSHECPNDLAERDLEAFRG